MLNFAKSWTGQHKTFPGEWNVAQLSNISRWSTNAVRVLADHTPCARTRIL